MDFSLSPDQRALQDSVNRVLRDVCPLDRVRRFAEADEPVAADIWRSLSALGVPGILVPEAQGGLGLGLLDAALVSEALGAHAAPVPFLGTALAVIALRAAGLPAQQARLLPGLASGEVTGAAALSEALAGGRDGAGLAATADSLTGTALFVIDGAQPGGIAAASRDGGLHWVDAGAAGLTLSAMPTIDRTRRLSEMRCDGTPAEALTGGNVVARSQALARLRDAAYVLLAGDMLGASQTMLDRAVAYAKERVQFGRPVGSFQAVKHLCAEMAARLEPCRALVWYAAHAWDEGLDDAPLAAAHAKAHLSEVSRFVARTATEVHGGMGFTDLLGLHYWFKRVGLDRQVLGGPEQLRKHAAALQTSTV
jgi:alkylation response protein AidB-like acyl-CoA dehydrogenase